MLATRAERRVSELVVTREYRNPVRRFQTVPSTKTDAFDIDRRPVGQELDGPFHVLAEQEKLIGADPAAL